MSAPADLVIVGRVATLAGESGFGWAEGVAIRDGRVVAAGRTDEVAAQTGAGTRTWHLPPGQMAMPGITDAHLHLLTGALETQQIDLEHDPDRTAILRRIAQADRRMRDEGDEGWLLGSGWSLDRIGRWPSVEDLERAAPGRSVALWSHDHHSRWVSAAALRAASIGPGTPDPEGGVIRRDEAGRPTGILHEHAVGLVSPAIPRPRVERLEAGLLAYSARLAALGVVAAHDPGELSDDPELRWGPTFYRMVAERGRLPLRVVASIRPEQVGRAIERGFHSGDMVEPADATDPAAMRAAGRYRGGWLKLFADGTLGSRSAALLAAYEPEPGGRQPVGGPWGMLLRRPDALEADARRGASNRIAVQIHGIGDRAVRVALDILGGLPAPPDGFHHRVEHAQLIHPADVPRFAAQRIVASMQPSHLITDEPIARVAWGGRIASMFPIGGLAASGALVAFGTDAPIESPDPWPGIASAVTRAEGAWAAERGAFHPEQAIDLARAIRAACLDPPLAAGEGDRGRLVAGHRADLVVIPAESLAEPVRPGGALAATRPLATVLDGEAVYRDPSFDPGD